MNENNTTQQIVPPTNPALELVRDDRSRELAGRLQQARDENATLQQGVQQLQADNAKLMDDNKTLASMQQDQMIDYTPIEQVLDLAQQGVRTEEMPQELLQAFEGNASLLPKEDQDALMSRLIEIDNVNNSAGMMNAARQDPAYGGNAYSTVK